jgi:hypothetical protein
MCLVFNKENGEYLLGKGTINLSKKYPIGAIYAFGSIWRTGSYPESRRPGL